MQLVRFRYPTIRSIAISVVLAVVVSACSNGGGSADPTPTETPTSIPDTPSPSPTLATAGAGLQAAVTAAEITDGRAVITFSLTDASGHALRPSLAATQNPQEARVRFTLAHLEEYSGGGDLANNFWRYVNDVNATRPAYDRGTLQPVDAAAGVYQYTFAVALPAEFVATNTYAVGMQVDRNFESVPFSVNQVFDFVPAGGEPRVREGVTTAQCNTCHDPLVAHGTRREVRLCTTCHTEAAVDEKGRSIDLRDMIHKIHAGKELPSVADGPPGSAYGIYSSFARADVVFAHKDENGVVSGIGFPRPLQDCVACHADGPTAEFHLTKPSAAACASCHDNVNPSLETTAAGPPGTNHFEERGYADGQCSACHTAEMEEEFDESVPGAHVVPERSAQLAGLNVVIEGIEDHGAGEMPLVSFKVTEDDGTVLRSLSGLNRLGFTIAGPTDDYSMVIALTAAGGGATGMLSGPDDSGQFQYRAATAIPADATGTWAIGAEARRSVMVSGRSVNEAAANPVVTFATDDAAAMARREIVETQRCEVCHGEFSKGFSIHGNLRNQVEYCVLCHNPNASDVSRRSRDAAAVAAGDPTASIDFKVMIHKIHRGEDLEQHPYTIYGFGAAPLGFTRFDFSEVLFPGDLRNCETCHLPGTYLIPPFPEEGVLGTRQAHLDPATGREIEDARLAAITAVCTSCHDSDEARAHAETQTALGGAEACAVCHGEGRPYSVSAMHAR